MIGNSEIIQKLNELLTLELTAIDAYFVQSKVCEDLGYTKLKDHFEHELEEEKVHSSSIIERILFLEGIPDIGTRKPFSVDLDVEKIINLDLQMEIEVAIKMKEVINLSLTHSDHVTREVIEKLLVETESDHIFWLESQQKIIKSIGIKNYLSEKI